MILEGIPKKTPEWNLEIRNSSWVAVVDGDLKIEFQLRFPVSEEGVSNVHAVESLLALAINNPNAITFVLEHAAPDVYLSLNAKTLGGYVSYGYFGQVPQPVSMFLSQAWSRIGEVEAEKFFVEMSTVQQSASPSKFFDVADEVDDLSEKQYSELMENIKGSMIQPIYNVKIGLKVSEIQRKKESNILLGVI